MEITYIGHSGFLIEWETCYWLFDYFKGDIPEMNSEKKLYVFASHKHGDHYNPQIIELYNKYKDIQYVLSSDIKLEKDKGLQMATINVPLNNILSVKPSNEYELVDGCNNKIILKTLKSTDCGVAFLLCYQGKTIYHAGDLNLWVWKEESKQYNNNMTVNFNKIISELKGLTIDIAFTPLDPRQEEWYYLGLESLLSTANVKYVFPMHFWDKPSIIQKFKSECAINNSTEIMDVNLNGQKWTIEI